MDITIVPLVKNKSGDLTDVNNYRAIALSNAMTKILQRILLSKISYSKECDNYQFGFKKGHSTTLCAGVVKQTLEYYASRGSHVFLCSVDFTKAFDRVNYWKLFKHLLDNGVCVSIVKLLAYWYSNQTASVLWRASRSNNFEISNGTKHGGVLSPFLFSCYIQPLLQQISSCGIGCHIGGMATNIFAYADDIVLLAPSWAALQYLIVTLGRVCMSLNIHTYIHTYIHKTILCNLKKTVCMVKPA